MFLAIWLAILSSVLCLSECQRVLDKPGAPQRPLETPAYDTLERDHLEEDAYQFDLNALLALHRSIISIPSVSGDEHKVALFIRDYLRSVSNLEIELQPVVSAGYPTHSKASVDSPSKRYNVFAYPPDHRQTPVLLTSHIDTVPPHIPYSHNGDEIWGRGSVDAKACVATQIFAYLQLVRTGQIKAQDASLLFVVGEEADGAGMLTANSLGIKWKTVIFGEPTELKLASGHKGLVIFHVTAKGKGGHSGYPWLGESAIDMLMPALLKLKMLVLPSSEKYGNSTVNVGLLRGGVAPNVIPQEAEAAIGVRIAAGEPRVVQNMLLKAIKEVDERLEVNFFENAYGPVEIDHDILGFETMTVNYGTDIPNMEGNHKSYLFGPGSILVAHSDHEHLRVQDLKDAVDGYKKLLLHALKQ